MFIMSWGERERERGREIVCKQCDQIGRFIIIWATFQSLGQPFLPKSSIHFKPFCKSVKIVHFTREILFGQLYRHLATFYWSHCVQARKRKRERERCEPIFGHNSKTSSNVGRQKTLKKMLNIFSSPHLHRPALFELLIKQFSIYD